MKAEDFTRDKEVVELLRRLNRSFPGKHISDIVDKEGNQYVDLVMEGGGVLGIALVGYTYILEEMRIRFLGVGGTSAGSINALLIASMGAPAERKSGPIITALANLPLWDLVDGGNGVQRFLRAFLRKAWIPILGLAGLMVIHRVFRFLGLNPGDKFRSWLVDVLKGAGIGSVRDLRTRLATLPEGLKRRGGKKFTVDDAGAHLAIVSADITTQTKVVFPEMGPLYWEEPDRVNPADWVRASMAIPFFFEPFVAESVPRDAKAVSRWATLAHLNWDQQKVPARCVLVDGGIMSNFPIDLFHCNDAVPDAPTFGVKLGGSKRQLQVISNPFKLGGAAFNAARHTLDFDFICRHPDYQKLVAHVDTTGFNWLDFGMSDRQKIDLFVRGARAAAEFLEKFNWAQYKKIRKGSVLAYRAATKAIP
jgi:NTE family protein